MENNHATTRMKSAHLLFQREDQRPKKSHLGVKLTNLPIRQYKLDDPQHVHAQATYIWFQQKISERQKR